MRNSILNFLIYEENLIFFFISAVCKVELKSPGRHELTLPLEAGLYVSRCKL
jgi:hypothetical protein